ncbi:putative vitellogenin receptor [Thelohanellus kitauei]|uniref:Putative vitellogenin receptor n=1 Tax=Thelohanellus kitauei TaxID=669202 RepID=A0A0C2MZ14_THEKT|nr:putative vitellogenin receptor [Thelohanellus kitauei]
MTTSGDEIMSFMVVERVQEIGYSENSYNIYTESKLFKVDLNNYVAYLERNIPKTLKMIEYESKDKCDGVDNCPDASDEFNCPAECQSDQFLCFKDKKCLSLDNICDGKEDCSDGIDEVDCSRILPRCQEGMFECFNQTCINSQKVCDGYNDCGDLSDEIDCKEKRCALYGSYCDDGTCLYHHQMCDGVYHCNDFSDERACAVRVFESPNMNCLVKCDDKCVEMNKICNHFSDCTDFLDEKDCEFEFILTIKGTRSSVLALRIWFVLTINPATAKKKYVMDLMIVLMEQMNKTVQVANLYIFATIPCLENIYIPCQNKNQRICISKMCDNMEDCSDGSDENLICYSQNFSRAIDLNLQDYGSVDFSWGAEDSGNSYLVTVINLDTKNILIEQVVKHVHLNAGGHVHCGRYMMIIKNTINFNILFRSYKYIPIKTHTPTNLVYNQQSRMLTWDADPHNCVPRIFYIECYKNVLVLRNFTFNNSLKIHSINNMACKVAACPYQVYNQSCSPFSKTVDVYMVPEKVLSTDPIETDDIVEKFFDTENSCLNFQAADDVNAFKETSEIT